jgi:hypothetical protein
MDKDKDEQESTGPLPQKEAVDASAKEKTVGQQGKPSPEEGLPDGKPSEEKEMK